MDIPLAKALWNDLEFDRSEAWQEFTATLSERSNYTKSLERLRELSSHDLLSPTAVQESLEIWPWSIDLLLLAVDVAADPAAALSSLEAQVKAQNRRFAALAWSAWFSGDCERARAAVETLDPRSETFEADRAARAELAILSAETPEPIAGPQGARLSMLHIWRTQGPQALRRRIEVEFASLPASPPLWTTLIEIWITERDFAFADQLQRHFETVCGAHHPEALALRVRLSLERDDAKTARALLNQVANPALPWTWTQRQHAQNLRCLMLEAASLPDPDYQNVLHYVRAATRLFPRNLVLQGLWQSARELTEDWDALATDLAPSRLNAANLWRLGLPELGLQIQEALTPPTRPDEAQWTRLKSTELHLRQGNLAKAQSVLGPAPAPWPHRADHAYWASEIALANRDFPTARQALMPALALGPTRMGLVLNAARLAYFEGQFDEALAHLDQFRVLKTEQIGMVPPDDLRDLIVQDAACAHKEARDITTSPGLAARVFAVSPPVFAAVTANRAASIPQTIAHYWEGKRSAPIERGIRQWSHQHPEFTQTVFGPTEAALWLAQHAPNLCPLFDRLTQPALRADLFRIALIAQNGGVYADLDEYPRHAVTPWLKDARAVLVIEEGHATIANNFLAAVPGLPLFQRLLDRIAKRLIGTETPYAWWDTGPAQLTLDALIASRDPHEALGLRFLSQADYESRVSTNLPFPHKRSATHWRS